MCGICGSIDAEMFGSEDVLASLLHRGPDSGGEAAVGRAWLANRRLAIIDLSSTGDQPMRDSSRRFTLVFNGEIYNFLEIRAQLLEQGATFRGHSDTEVLVEAWSRWGTKAIPRLRGMFAFAVWDSREEVLYLVRDRLGEKPLYFTQQKDAFLFASEVRTLLASRLVPRRLSDEGLDAYLTFGATCDPFTLVDGVFSVEAGTWLEVRGDVLTVNRYWSLDEIDLSGVIPDEATAIARTGDLLRSSFRQVMEADVPVGVLLSGGIDSSACIVLLRELEFRDVRSFSVVFQGPDSRLSERRWSDLVAERFNTRHTRVGIGDADASAWAMEAVARMDQPSFDGINSYIVCKAIAGSGIKVAISGQGADEVFLGYGKRRLFPYLSAAGALPSGPFAALDRQLKDRPWVRDSRVEKLLQLLSSGAERGSAAYIANHSLYSQRGLERLRRQPRPPQSRFVPPVRGSSWLNKLSRLELGNYLKNTLLRDGDQMAMANSIELRQPYLDHPIVEYVLSLPTSYVAKPWQQKPLLVDAIGPRLPPEVIKRPKQGFVMPMTRWMNEGLRVANDPGEEVGLDPAAVRDVATAFARDESWTHYWSLQVLSAWCQQNGLGAA